MRPTRVILWFALGWSAQAGIIHGIIIEAATSRPLSRTRVKLQAIASTGEVQSVATAFTNRSGQYWFPSLPDGRYLVSAVRGGYIEAAFGQRRPQAPGAPIPVAGDSSTFAELRLRKLGAITGKIVDENYVALQGVNVIAYPASLPLRMATVGKTDDRGVYRLFGLNPGRYWVRNAAADLEDGGILPTFFPGSLSTAESRIVRVDLDSDASDIDFQPLPGRLFKMSGRVICPPGEAIARITLSSDTGRKETTAPCLPAGGPFTFDQLAPGNYEILAEPGTMPDSGGYWSEFMLERDSDHGAIQMTRLPEVDYRLRGKDNATIQAGSVQLQLRRRDLAGEGPHVAAKQKLLPGYWELFVRPGLALAFTRFDALPRRIDRSGNLSPNAPLFNVERNDRAVLEIYLSNTASINGVVKRDGEPLYGAPVFLYPVDADLRRRTHGYLTLHTDFDGKFNFTGLPPGEYLIVSSLDMEEITESTLTEAKAAAVSLKEGLTETVVLGMDRP